MKYAASPLYQREIFKQSQIFLHKTCQFCEENYCITVKNSYNYIYFPATRACQHNSQVGHRYQHFHGGTIYLASILPVPWVMRGLFVSSLALGT